MMFPKENSLPWTFWRFEIAERMGWTLPQVDALSMRDLEDYFQIQDGKIKAKNSILR